MRIAIIDDEKYYRMDAEQRIKKINSDFISGIELFSSGEALLESKKVYDVILVDVEMPGIDGFSTIQRYREINPEVIPIVLTMYPEMSRKGYLVNAFRYIDKIKIEEELEEALLSAEKCIGRNRLINVNIIGKGMVRLPLKEINYMETDKHNVKIHLEDAVFVSDSTIGEMEKDLEEYGFYRCHKSYLVNLDKIQRFDKVFVHLSNGEKIYVSTRRYAQLNKKYIERKYSFANA